MRIRLVLALICLLAGLIAQYTFRAKEPGCFCTTASRLIWVVGWTGVEIGGWESFHLCQVRRLKKKVPIPM